MAKDRKASPPSKTSTETQIVLAKIPPERTTVESTYFLRGLWTEFHDQVHKYGDLTATLREMEARVELAEKTLCLTRDHLAMTVEKTECAVPNDWGKVFNSVRFVGVRLTDACITLLREHKRLTQTELLENLNSGMFRFRTNAPLREIHAALLRQRQNVKREGDTWIWTGPEHGEVQTRLRLMRPEIIEADDEGDVKTE